MMTKAKYKRYLKTPHWLATKNRRLEKAGHQCERVTNGKRCSARKFLHVHHIHYATLGRENDDDLEVLCEKHHEEMHPDKQGFFQAEREEEALEMAQEILKSGYRKGTTPENTEQLITKYYLEMKKWRKRAQYYECKYLQSAINETVNGVVVQEESTMGFGSMDENCSIEGICTFSIIVAPT